jgi:hypothetical protein
MTAPTATITFSDRRAGRYADQNVTITYSDGRPSLAGVVYHSEREGAPSADAWLSDSLCSGCNFGGPAEVLQALLTRGNADGSPMVVEVPSLYEAADYGDGWHVTHANLAVWWPGDAAKAEIEASDDPEQTILRLCHEQPSAGEWYT